MKLVSNIFGPIRSTHCAFHAAIALFGLSQVIIVFLHGHTDCLLVLMHIMLLGNALEL